MFMKSLGSTLKELREIHRFTLRQVEEATGISNAYLSQLENDKIAKPSANVLYKLSNIYNVELDTLLAAAGIIEKKSSSQSSGFLSFFEKSIFFFGKEISSFEIHF